MMNAFFGAGSISSFRSVTPSLKLYFLSVVFVAISTVIRADDFQPVKLRLDDNWKFFLGDPAHVQDVDFNDSAWRAVTLPHDWSIEGKFDAKNPSGGGGGFLPTGVGWYRLMLDAPLDWQGKKVSVEFEGVYKNADVWLNGEHLARHPYGFTSFFVDFPSTLKIGGKNVLAVRVDNSQQQNCRWYSGSGIYRHVWLQVVNPVHVTHWGSFVKIPKADEQSATVQVQTSVINEGSDDQALRVQTVLLSPSGKEVGRASSDCDLKSGQSQDVTQEIAMVHPALWSPANPQLSKAVTILTSSGSTVDRVESVFGIRSLAWSSDKGYLLNGEPLKLTGGCIHDDNGVLGAAAFDRAEERKIELLKAAGFNELRMAHNPPSPALLDACDRLGMLVMDEAFDCWTQGKMGFDYNRDFKDWWQRDIDSMVMRDRNHPSVIFWSTGNEIPGAYDSNVGGKYGQLLADRIRSLDPTRPVTQGILAMPKTDEEKAVAEQQRKALDIVGGNYNLVDLIKMEPQHPERVLVATESGPGNPIEMYNPVMSNVFVVGDNVWAAQDYLGEVGGGRWVYAGDPTEPYFLGSTELFPWHGDSSGDLDLIGQRKPMSHLRNIVWDRGEKLYMAVRQPEDEKKIVVTGWGFFPTSESWTWPGREGKEMQVDVYSRYDKVSLYLNDKLIEQRPVTREDGFRTTFKVNYEPGTLRAEGEPGDPDSNRVELTTVGDPAAISLNPDRDTITADGQDLSFIDVEVTDDKGRLQPNADQEISFDLTGPGSIQGLGNADVRSLEPYQGSQCRVFHGRALVVIRSTKTPGTIVLHATGPGLSDTSCAVQTK